MDKAYLQKLSLTMRISPEQVFREYWEMTLLKELSEESWSVSLGFKGGTALRLAYGSPRFSDDIDFTLLQSLKATILFTWADKISGKYKLEITDSVDKRNTILVEFRIRSAALPQPVKQKIEISKRIPRDENELFQLKLLSSPTTNAQVLISVASLELIWKEKLSAMKERSEPRDIFDLWYISQKLKKNIPQDLPKIPSSTLRMTLNRYLPSNYKKIISELEDL